MAEADEEEEKYLYATAQVMSAPQHMGDLIFP